MSGKSQLSSSKALFTQLDHEGNEENTANLTLEGWYHSYRRYALSIAYRMLGTMADAEDVVQDCFLELQQKPDKEVRNAKAYVAKMTVNRCLNFLNSARRQRETYFGEWLPEPVAGSGPAYSGPAGMVAAAVQERSDSSAGSHPDTPEDALERKDMISYAFLVMLEKLNPTERAVFVLREVFGYDYKEIAGMIGKTESNCRQLYSRSRRSLAPEGALSEDAYDFVLPDGGHPDRRHLLERFTEAFLAYDTQALLGILAEEPEFVSDGGGLVHTVLRPMKGRRGVLALLTSPRVLNGLREAERSLQMLNGELQLVFREKGRISAVLCLVQGKDGRIQNLYLIVNPHKLERVFRSS